MMPRLKAEEAIAAADTLAFGTGNLTKDQARDIAGKWETAARGEGGKQRKKERPSAEGLAAMGISVTTVHA